ncbi:uncharacterized protein BCR38DRAFT_431168 [Pseudomassariella vexata]|uniref:F-box domain-containing protein n=1 Tax=Pseudomassariella vexata TaxID=1141098 RepID=A0A1Y2DZZ8_9PEZI|nr:uncharacterized protein BCR38DRAFT_431168 [Pseudomassariella vexata]ORY64860.1 hypothetical protein BCR38DRAFT_431168 [Pseudomassariella vexata]
MLSARWKRLSFDLQDCKQGHASACWGKFKIPKTLLVASQATQSSALLQLPNELLLLIFRYTRLVGDLALALTCKRLLVVSSMTAIRIPSAARHRAVPDLNCAGMLRLLRVMEPPKRPSRWALCCDCYRWRPKRQVYWKSALKKYAAESSSRLLKGYCHVVESWSRKSSPSYQCPECWCAERSRKYGHCISK